MSSFHSWRAILIITFAACFAGAELKATADDWPQFLGPQRNGVASNEELLDKWGDNGPERIWSHKCGEGFAGVAVKDDRVFLFHRKKAIDIVECLNAKDGTLNWQKDFVASYGGGATADLGPRCVPLVHGDSVYCFGAAGTLRRLSQRDGKELWSKNLFELYKANTGYFGAGSAPMIAGETIVVIVGGRNAGIVGLDLDGNERWKTEPDTASYSAPVGLDFEDKKCVACVSKYHLKIIEVESGKVLLEQEFGKRGPTVNAAAPLVFDNKLFITAAYNIGGRMISLESKKTLWANDTSMSSQYSTAIPYKGHLIGCHGREDFGDGTLKCVRAQDGKVVWSESGTGICHFIKVGERALVWNVDGSLRLIQLRTDKYQELAQATIFEGNSKSLPALSNGRLFVKANGDQGKGELVCLKVGR